MASSGFRRPQFSEELAWLPAWLQPHQELLFNEHIKDGQTPSQQACKDLVFLQGNISEGKDVDLFPREDARYNGCHLFLSGDDNSPVGMTPSSGNLHFHLHLSSDGISQHTPSSICNILQTERHESNKMLSMQSLPETSDGPEVRGCQKKMEDKAGMVNVPLTSKSRMSKNSRRQSLTKDNKKSGRKHQEKFDAIHLINADNKDAVELSIAASEALVISDSVKGSSASVVLPAAAVLEVALRVKQARNHLCSDGLENVSDCVTEEVDETDLLLDLDEDTMADAFEDVGLSVTKVVATPDDLCCSSSVIKQGCSVSGIFSRVLDTPVSENHYGCDGEVKNVEHRAQEVDFDGVSSQKKFKDAVAMDSRLSKDSPLESVGGVWQKKLCGDPLSGFNNSSVERHLKPHLYQSFETNSNVLATAQGVNIDMVDKILFHTQASIVSSPRVPELGESVGAENEVYDLVPDRFRSRWLGGWTGKDVEVSIHVDPNTTKSIPKFFNGETSFFSESADVVPDENSSIQKPEVGPKIDLLSSIAFEGLCSISNEGIILSQDPVRSSSLSLVDPLCSIVPCSISSDNANVTLPTNQNNLEGEAGKCLNPPPELGLENLHLKSIGSSVEFAHGEGHMLRINCEGSGATSRRHLTSLKAYSMLLPPQNASSEKGSVYRNGSVPKAGILGLLRSEEIVNWSSNKKDCTDKDYEKDHETSALGKPITELTDQKKSSDETINDEAELQKERCSPLILNYGSRRRLQASKVVLINNTGDVNLRTAPIPVMTKTRNVASCGDQSKTISLSVLHSSRHPHPGEDQSPAKKRVRFSEAEVKFQQSKSGPKPRSGHRTRTITRTGKRLKECCLQSDFRTQEVNTNLTNCHIEDSKRMIFQGLEFMLTGFASHREKELERLIRKHGGFVLSDVPSPAPNLRGKRRSRCKYQQLPVVLSPKKLQTTKFLYGCAVNAFLLKVNWLTDSIAAGSVLPPEKYVILSNQDDMKRKRIGRPVRCDNRTYIFDSVGIMLHGKHSFCTKLSKIVKHGGGQVFKTLQWLVQSLKNGKISVGAIVAEDEGRASRHLRHCASEQKLLMVPASWIINSLHLGKLLAVRENNHSIPSHTAKIAEFHNPMELSEEI